MIKSYLSSLLILFLQYNCPAQNIYNKGLLDSLNEIAATNTISRHFAKMYYQTVMETNLFLRGKSENVRQFIFGFESAFGQIFREAHMNYKAHKNIILEWQDYYRTDSLNEIQYQFMGMNAHINGDMHKGLIEKYNYDTIKKYKRELQSFRKPLKIFYDSLYRTTFQYSGLRKLHRLSLGSDKFIGWKMILHWRHRQLNLALLYYKNPTRYNRRLKHVQRILQRWDKRAMHFFK